MIAHKTTIHQISDADVSNYGQPSGLWQFEKPIS